MENKEIMIKLKVSEANGLTSNLEYQMKIRFKNKAMVEKPNTSMKVTNEETKKLIYIHDSEEVIHVCFQSNVEVYATISIDVRLELPEDLVETKDFHELENLIYNTNKMYLDFNSKTDELDLKDQAMLDDNIKLNSNIIKGSFVQVFVLMFLAFVQYGMLRHFIKK